MKRSEHCFVLAVGLVEGGRDGSFDLYETNELGVHRPLSLRCSAGLPIWHLYCVEAESRRGDEVKSIRLCSLGSFSLFFLFSVLMI